MELKGATMNLRYDDWVALHIRKSLLAMLFAGLMFMAAAALICFLGKEIAWYFVAAALIAGGISQFALQDVDPRAQIVSISAAYIATACLISGLTAAILGY